MQGRLEMISPYLLTAGLVAACWLAFAVLGILVMYVGYGFAMAGKRARDIGLSQKYVVIVDVCIALPFVILDATLNLFVFSFLFLDFRPKALFTLVTGRLCFYNANRQEREWRLWLTGVFAAFLNGKDPDGHHIKGNVPHFKWLDRYAKHLQTQF